MAVKRGDMVRAVRAQLENSLEAKASDARFPTYIFDSKGEILEIKGDYALVLFGQVSTPNIWLRLDQLEPFDQPSKGKQAEADQGKKPEADKDKQAEK